MPAPEDVELTFPPEGGCFGCSTANPTGLQLRFRRRGDEIRSTANVPDRFHGAPGITHGGIVATLLDEISCVAAVFLRDQHVVTGELQIRYSRPCPVETPLELKASVIEETSRWLVIAARVEQSGTILATSSGKFFPRRDGPGST